MIFRARSSLCCVFHLLTIIFYSGGLEVRKSTANDDPQLGFFNSKEVCMKELGCFSITDDFRHIIYRPFNVLPNDRAIINTRHLLYTRNNLKEPDILVASDRNSIMGSHFDSRNPTKFIVHGYMDNELFGKWMLAMKDEFLLNGDYNIILVDWSGGNHGIYAQATANTRVVGAEIALIIKYLEKYTGLRPENVHIIGHSLGAHAAGYAGERLEKLGRITGCDPAQPYFQKMPPSVRLDETDAEYVDVIHSDAKSLLLLGFGMSQMIGHADFFPNDGRNQPGCKKDKITSFAVQGIAEGVKRFVSCNHQRALDFMINSINFKKKLPVAYECADWKSFLQGQCADCGRDMTRCAIMGNRADAYIPHKNNSIKHAFYLKTSASSPFWLYHYQISIKLHRPRSSYKDPSGRFEIVLHGEKEDILTTLEKEDDTLHHGARYKYLITTPKDLGAIKSVTLKWFSSSYNPIHWLFKPKLYVHYVTVVPMYAMEKSPRDMTNRVFCRDPEKPMLPKVLTYFHKDNNCL